MLVYSRRPKVRGDEEENTHPCHESDPNHEPNMESYEGKNSQCNTSETNKVSNEQDDINIPIALRKGKRSCTAHPISNFMMHQSLSASHKAFESSLDSIKIPKCLQEVLQHPEWNAAVDEEMNALLKNHTWEYSNLPTRKQTVGCKWVCC